MSFLDAIRHRGRAFLRRDEFDRALHDEIEFHLALDRRQHDDDDARRRFGNVAYPMGETRRRSPGLSVGSILPLALCIGLTTAAVSIADHVLLRALPFRDSAQLVMLLE